MSLENVTRQSLGLHMRQARQARRWSLEVAFQHTGMPVPVLGAYERAHRNPSISNTIAWVAAFDRRIVVLDPGEVVVNTDRAMEQYVTYVVVTSTGVEISRCSTLVAAEVVQREVPGSRVGYRLMQRGPIEYGTAGES